MGDISKGRSFLPPRPAKNFNPRNLQILAFIAVLMPIQTQLSIIFFLSIFNYLIYLIC